MPVSAMPHYDVAIVRELARRRAAVLDRYRAPDAVVQNRLDLGAEAARALIVSVIAELNVAQFWKTDTGPQWIPADVYGWMGRGCGWYVKLQVIGGRVCVLSFHPPERPFRTMGGEVIR